MKSKITAVKSTAVIRTLQSFGFREAPIPRENSHSALVKSARGKILLVIVPESDNLLRGTLRCIIDSADLSIEEFLERLKKSE